MSRYDLTPRDPRHEVSIGWDPCLANHFLQVVDREISEDDTDHDRFLVWRGADGYATEPDMDELLEEAARWALLPPDLSTTLLADREREGTRPRPPLLFVNGNLDVF
jgi:hypothetical protein